MTAQTVGELIDTIRCELVDPDGDIWKDELLVDYIQQAYTHIVALCPIDFSEPREIILERGKCLQNVCDCTNLVSVVSVDGNDCNTLDQESSQDNINFLNQFFADDECPPKNPDEEEPYQPDSWSFVDCGSCASFRFNVATPDDRDVTAIICCTVDVDFCDTDIMNLELPTTVFGAWYEAFKHLILSKVYATDRKCKNLLALATYHYDKFQDARDSLWRVKFAKSQSDWHIYRQKTNASTRSD